MVRKNVHLLFPLLAVFWLAACGQKLNIEVKAQLDGKPAAQASVVVDGEQAGVTDEQGLFAQQLSKKAGSEITLTVTKEQPGYRIAPWKKTFLVKLPKDGEIDTYKFDAEFVAERFVTLRVADQGEPLSEAEVSIGGKKAGETDAKGELVYQYKDQSAKGETIQVSKSGYSAWRAKRKLEPGETIDIALTRRAVVTISALTDEYGRTSGLPGLTVSINGKPLGKTDGRGSFTYVYSGAPGKSATFTIAAPGYVPAQAKSTVKLSGGSYVQRYFYPVTPKPIRLGVYRVTGNTPGVDLKELAAQVEQELIAQLFKFHGFREVPTDKLQDEVQQRKLNVDRITTKGWHNTALRATVDMMVFGSIAKDDNGYVIEAKVHTAGGKVVISEIDRARSEGRIKGTVRDIAANIIERFPLEGTVIGSEGERHRINIGKNWRVNRGADLVLSTPTFGDDGKVSGYRDTGRLEVRRGGDTTSLADVVTLKQGEKVKIGDRVVRRGTREGEEDGQRTFFVLNAKGSLGSDVVPLAGANVYLDGTWAGATNAGGQAEVPLRLNSNYDLTVYRHGYQQLKEKIKIAKSGEARGFSLVANSALFRLETTPSPATVIIDDEQVGRTPMSGGRPVTFGFHSVRLTYGEDYRDFFEVMEFANKEEDRTGERRIVLHKDFVKIGERLRQKGDIDGAIQAYGSTERSHPDYAEAHRRLGQVYLDDKEDFDRAVDEFETVLSMPENKQLIYKQFAVTFTNLGHAYYEKGNRLVESDRNAAAEQFAKAIKSLQTARQNTRFFPNAEYAEAVHDTYYYTALAYHKLYLVTKQPGVMNSASLAWRDYFDFFPKKLEGQPAFEQARDAARRYRNQIGEP
jgi:tetratricopeptide (TPR) repeat protein